MCSDSPSREFVGVFGNRSGPRSRSGCRTCRVRKVKCDETQPTCRQCSRLSKICDWTTVPRKRPPKKARSKIQNPATVHDSEPVEGPELDLEPLESSVASDLSSDGIQFPNTPEFSRAPMRPSPSPGHSLTLSGPSASGLRLDLDRQKAIYFYKTWFASSVDTKNPEYSVPAIVLRTAAHAPAAMHMILAIGSEYRPLDALGELADGSTNSTKRMQARWHYGEALQLLSTRLIRQTTALDLDATLATLWLMLMYEQRFGDSPAQSLTAHLRGVVSVLQSANIDPFPDLRVGGGQTSLLGNARAEETSTLSCFGTRLIIWLLGLDARAASSGLGGWLNAAIAQSLGISYHHDAGEVWLRVLAAIHDKSAPLFRVTWGAEYPMSEILYDMEHKSTFELLRCCSQLRRMVADLASSADSEAKEAQAAAIESKLDQLRQEYADLFYMAEKMPEAAQYLSPGLALTLCWVIPNYHASVLDFIRASGREVDIQRKSQALEEITKLVMYGYQKGGPPAIVRTAWPLFVAGLEIADPFKQQWIVDRLQEIAPFGKSYNAAAQVLKAHQATGTQWGPGGEAFQEHPCAIQGVLTGGVFL